MPDTPKDLMAAWNEMAATCEAKQCLVLSKARLRHAIRRLKDPWWSSMWREGLAWVPKLAFLQGENDRHWRANIDWFLRETSLMKLLEGQYGEPDDQCEPDPDTDPWTRPHSPQEEEKIWADEDRFKKQFPHTYPQCDVRREAELAAEAKAKGEEKSDG